MADESNIRLTLKQARGTSAKYYWSGVACKNGHVGLRYAAGRRCVQCSKEQASADFINRREYYREKSKRWYSDKERARKKTAAWRAKNKEQNLKTARKWREENKDKVRAYTRKSFAKNKDKCYAANRRWYVRNQKEQQRIAREKRAESVEKYREYSRAYNANNRPLIAVHSRNRRARQLLAGGTHTARDVAAIFALQNERCAYCRVSLSAKYHVDHIMPISRGGSNGRANLQILCAPCNQSKSARDPIEFMQERGMLL